MDGDGVDDETNVQGRFLEDSELTLTNEKPYVVYGYAAVESGKTLEINPGARIHFHAKSGLLITENASLHINGTRSITSVIVFSDWNIYILLYLIKCDKNTNKNHSHTSHLIDPPDAIGIFNITSKSNT